MARPIATTTEVDHQGMIEFATPRHKVVLITRRTDGSLQTSPVTAGVDEGHLVIATYPDRAKAVNLRRNPAATVMVLSDEFNGPWLQIDGTAEVIDLPDSVEPLVDYFRSISGEHSDWDEYRQAMIDQGKSLIRVTPKRWGPIATGGFPAYLV